MNARIIRAAGMLLASFALASWARAADVPHAAAPDTDLRISLSPEAQKKADNAARAELYHRALDGDEKAREQWLEFSPAQRVRAMADVATDRDSHAARMSAIRELGQLSSADDPEAEGIAALAQLAVLDCNGDARALACTAIAARDDERALAPLGTALGHKDPSVRANAAVAFKALGGPHIFEVIIEHWKETWEPGPRAHCFFGQMRSYVADYDITGSAYDPIVRNFFTGVVLDAKSLRVERDIYYSAIRAVAPDGVKLPNNPAAWKGWLDKERDKLAADARRKRMRALAELAGPASE